MTDILALTPGKSVYIQGEIAVSAAGSLGFRFPSIKGLTAWLDDQPLPEGASPAVEVTEGSHKLTLRVDIASRELEPIKVELIKPEGSSIEFSVVGGR
jgi:hypothetical protein